MALDQPGQLVPLTFCPRVWKLCNQIYLKYLLRKMIYREKLILEI